MKFVKPLLAAMAIALILPGCTTHLADAQKRELEAYEQKGLYVKEKSPGTAAALGILPGAGYCYVGKYGLCLTTPLIWACLGFIWGPFDTYAAAENNNYYATKTQIEHDKARELKDIDHKMEDKQISYEQHIREQRAI